MMYELFKHQPDNYVRFQNISDWLDDQISWRWEVLEKIKRKPVCWVQRFIRGWRRDWRFANPC